MVNVFSLIYSSVYCLSLFNLLYLEDGKVYQVINLKNWLNIEFKDFTAETNPCARYYHIYCRYEGKTGEQLLL